MWYPCKKRGSQSYFMKLSGEVKMEILSNLRPRQLCVVACVCKEMRDLTSDRFFWETKMRPLLKSLCFFQPPNFKGGSSLTREGSPSKFMELPQELKWEILGNFRLWQLKVVGCVCKELRDLTRDSHFLISKVYSKPIKFDLPVHLLKSKPKGITSSSKFSDLPLELRIELLQKMAQMDQAPKICRLWPVNTVCGDSRYHLPGHPLKSDPEDMDCT